jgi:DNA-binding ferritin-like protein (Dps family)
VGKRKQNEDLTKIAEFIYTRAVKDVVEDEPSFQQYLDLAEKAKADAQSPQEPSE